MPRESRVVLTQPGAAFPLRTHSRYGVAVPSGAVVNAAVANTHQQAPLRDRESRAHIHRSRLFAIVSAACDLHAGCLCFVWNCQHNPGAHDNCNPGAHMHAVRPGVGPFEWPCSRMHRHSTPRWRDPRAWPIEGQHLWPSPQSAQARFRRVGGTPRQRERPVPPNFLGHWLAAGPSKKTAAYVCGMPR